MSAYIVEDETINNIIFSINRICKDKKPFEKILKTDYLTNQELGVELLKLNLKAVTSRYGKKKLEKGELNCFETFKYKEIYGLSLYQEVKTISCFLYQCSEGNVPNSKLFKLLDNLRGDISLEIVHNSKEWNLAKWG
jgi:hypothetical protein